MQSRYSSTEPHNSSVRPAPELPRCTLNEDGSKHDWRGSLHAHSARDVNMRYGSFAPSRFRSSSSTPMYACVTAKSGMHDKRCTRCTTRGDTCRQRGHTHLRAPQCERHAAAREQRRIRARHEALRCRLLVSRGTVDLACANDQRGASSGVLLLQRPLVVATKDSGSLRHALC